MGIAKPQAVERAALKRLVYDPILVVRARRVGGAEHGGVDVFDHDVFVVHGFAVPVPENDVHHVVVAGGDAIDGGAAVGAGLVGQAEVLFERVHLIPVAGGGPSGGVVAGGEAGGGGPTVAATAGGPAVVTGDAPALVVVGVHDVHLAEL